MQLSTFLIFAALIASGAHVQAQGLQDAISTPERAVTTTVTSINQTLTGTWLVEVRRAGQPAAQPPVPHLVVFHLDGTVVDAAAAGIWLRVGDRKFLQTMFVLNFNESGALATITKVRINAQLSADGLALRGTTEAVILSPEGKVMVTIPGNTYSGVRLNAEKPGDFDAFQLEQ